MLPFKVGAFFFSAWLAMVFWGMVAPDLGLPTIGYTKAMLVTIGLWLVVFPLAGMGKWSGGIGWARKSGKWEGRQASETSAGAVNVSAFFSGVSKRVVSKAFTGGSVRARFGGVEIYVPREWNVELDVNVFLGGVTDERSHLTVAEEGQPHLVIAGRAFLGGVEVKD